MAHTPLFRFLRRALHRAAADRQPSRRNFMRGISALALGSPLALAACTTPPSLVGRRQGDGPVVIVGGGLAGLTAAWELTKAAIPFILYEGSARLGGRVWSLRQFNRAAQFVELGAELVDSGHEDLMTLAKELGVGVTKFSAPEDGIVNELFHFRGQIYSGHDFEQALAPLLAAVGRARRDIQGRRRELAVSWDNPQGAARYDGMSLAEFLAAQSDVAAWVREMVRIAYVGEMGREAEEQSALNLILLMDPEIPGMYGESDEAWRIAGGSSSLVEALQRAIIQRSSASTEAVLRTEHELIAIREQGRELQLIFSHAGKLQAVNANQAILTLPFTMLRQVDGIRTLPLHPIKQRSIQNYGYGSNAKIMSDFQDRIWRRPGGRLRAFNGFLTTDGGPQTIWETSRDQTGSHGILTAFIGGKAAASLAPTGGRAVVDFLGSLDGRIARAFTGRQRSMNWSDHRWTRGSYSCPLVGQYTSFFGIESQPELGGRLLFAGEHTSIDYTGFMNGAIESGKRAARQVVDPTAKAA